MRDALHVGHVIAERYRIDQLASRGGMGAVYLGVDLRTGTKVGIKFARHDNGDRAAGRFWREASALSSVHHPGIVGYHTHGMNATGTPYLIMEWLDGKSLQAVMEHRRLDVQETVRLGIRICEAVSAAHREGLIHRDIKPSNILLRDDDIEGATLVDFGLVRMKQSDHPDTTEGTIMGTPSFMAPEQAMAMPELDERADIYSIGALLFTVAAHRPPFIGRHATAILAKVLFEDAPRLSELRDDVPPALDQLVADLLAKQPEDRPASAREVGRTLAKILAELGERRVQATLRSTAPAITTGEQRFLTVLIMAGRAAARSRERRQALARHAVTYGGAVNELADGTIAGVFCEGGEPHDIAIRAARCALAIQAELDVKLLVLATGRGIAHGRLPVGQVIDHAVALFTGGADTVVTDATPRPIASDHAATAARPRVIIDEVTARFLGRQFKIAPLTARRYTLLDRQRPSGRAARLLGMDTRCVGRARELASLTGVLDESIHDRVARGVLVTAEPGVGKSRVCDEFVSRVALAYEHLAVWSGAGDWLRSGASFGLLGAVIRDAIGLTQGLATGHSSGRIAAHMAQLVAPEEASRVAEFVGELVGVPFSDADRVELMAARRDPQLMHDQTLRAFVTWLRAEVERRPVVIVLDDLQWGDRPTLRFLEAAMRALREQPLMVLALARPEFPEIFPGLLDGQAFEQLRLRPLSRRACRDMIEQVIEVPDDTAERLARRCAGNALYLEELIRNVAAGESERFPETVLAMTEARLGALPPEERRVLRAASVVGRHFWRQSVAALLGDAVQKFELDRYLRRLVEREFIVEQTTSRFPDQAEFLFSHDVTREAIYGTLTEDDRARGHLFAGTWLHQAGETESIVLAEHFQRGGAMQRAVTWYLRAARQALDADDVDAVLDRVQRACDCGAAGETLGALKLLEAEAHNWRSRSDRAQACSQQAIARLPPGSADWANAIHQRVWASAMTGKLDEVDALIDALIDRARDNDDARYIVSMARCAPALAVVGRRAQARAIEACVEQNLDRGGANPTALATMTRLRSFLAYMDNQLDRACDLMLDAASYWRSIGNERCALMDLGNAGTTQFSLGEYERAAESLGMAVAAAERANLDYLVITNKANWARALAHMGQLTEARELCRDALGTLPAPRHEVFVRTYMAQILLIDDTAAEALDHAARALTLAEALPELKPMVLGVHAQALLALDRAQDALAAAEQGMALLRELGAIEAGEGVLRLAHAEALDAVGQRDRACQAALAARERLIARAKNICDPERRRGFFQIPEHARTIELARAWSSGSRWK